jgi:hypothetical protein
MQTNKRVSHVYWSSVNSMYARIALLTFTAEFDVVFAVAVGTSVVALASTSSPLMYHSHQYLIVGMMHGPISMIMVPIILLLLVCHVLGFISFCTTNFHRFLAFQAILPLLLQCYFFFYLGGLFCYRIDLLFLQCQFQCTSVYSHFSTPLRRLRGWYVSGAATYPNCVTMDCQGCRSCIADFCCQGRIGSHLGVSHISWYHLVP